MLIIYFQQIIKQVSKSSENRNVEKWEIVEINDKMYETASIAFTQFFEERKYPIGRHA